MLERHFENHTADLADRIVRASYAVTQRKSVWQKIKAGYRSLTVLFAECALPNPAYVMPAVFVLGVLLSISLYPAADMNEYVETLYYSI